MLLMVLVLLGIDVVLQEDLDLFVHLWANILTTDTSWKHIIVRIVIQGDSYKRKPSGDIVLKGRNDSR